MGVFLGIIGKIFGVFTSVLGLAKGAWASGVIKNLALGLWNSNKMTWLSSALGGLGTWFLESWKNNKKNWIIGILSALVILLGILLWNAKYSEPAVHSEGTSQVEAETVGTVDEAALRAQIEMQDSQLKEATKEIERLKNEKPEKIVTTTEEKLSSTVESERIKDGADFALVTDPNNPNLHVDLDNISPYSRDAKGNVLLYQYNVFAYKDTLKSITVDTSDLRTVDTVTAEYSKKITKDGKYLGATLGYDIPDKRVKVGLKYTY